MVKLAIIRRTKENSPSRSGFRYDPAQFAPGGASLLYFDWNAHSFLARSVLSAREPTGSKERFFFPILIAALKRRSSTLRGHISQADASCYEPVDAVGHRSPRCSRKGKDG